MIEASKFENLLLAEYPYIGVFYIPLKFLLFSLIIIIFLCFIVEFIHRKLSIGHNNEIKLASFMVFKIILASQLLPLIVSIIYISFAIDIFNGLDFLNVMKFSSNKINLFVLVVLVDLSIFIVSLYVLFKPNIRESFGLELLPVGLKTTFYYFFIGSLVLYLTVIIYSSFFARVDSVANMYLELSKSASPTFIATVIFAGLVLAPIGEEILFRGVIYTAIKERLGFTAALILQSALFSIIHYDSLVLLFFLAIISTILYEKTKSLYPSIGVHFINNLIFYLSVFL